MGTVRNLASRLLHSVLRCAPPASREWAEAMLRELDYIEGEWAALFWALGSTTAIFRQACRDWLAKLTQPSQEKEKPMNQFGKRTVGVLSGAGLAVALVFMIFGMVQFVAILFPSIGFQQADWMHVLTVFVLPEVIFVIAALALWKKRGPVAAGILVTAVLFAAHVTAHFWVR